MNLQVNDRTTDVELEGKTKLFNEYVEELNKYFNEQTLEILKTLKFTFSTKSNDERVKQIKEERNIE
jgi:O6-methylguanine-DNA--protein-cysteine methyltransferase